MMGLIISLIGVYFLVTAGLKAYFSRQFITHVRRFELVPEGPAALVALLFIEIEAGLGMALLLGVNLQITIPATLFLVAFFSVILFWGFRSKGLEECGCYGGVIQLKPKHSLTISLVVISILALIWRMYPLDSGMELRPILWVLATVLIFHFMAKQTVQRPLFDPLRLKIGRTWNQALYRLDSIPTPSNRFLIFFIEGKCPRCQNWLDRLEVAKSDSQLQPGIFILVPQENEEIFQDFNNPSDPFKLAFIKNKFSIFLKGRFPLAVLVEDGLISKIWTYSFPEEALDEFIDNP